MAARSAALRNLAALVVLGAVLRRVDGSDPRAVLAARALFFAYVVGTLVLSALTLRRIVLAHDLRRVPVPAVKRGDVGARAQTVHEHDLRALWARFRGFALNVAVLCVVHARAGALAPLVVASMLGAVRLWDDRLTQVHVRGFDDSPPRNRPWDGAAGGPLAALLSAARGAGPPAQAPPVRPRQQPAAGAARAGRPAAGAARLRRRAGAMGASLAEMEAEAGGRDGAPRGVAAGKEL